MKLTKYIAALATASAVTSCGTAPPKAIPVGGPDSFGEMMNGMRDVQQFLREGRNTIQEFQRFRQL